MIIILIISSYNNIAKDTWLKTQYSNGIIVNNADYINFALYITVKTNANIGLVNNVLKITKVSVWYVNTGIHNTNRFIINDSIINNNF